MLSFSDLRHSCFKKVLVEIEYNYCFEKTREKLVQDQLAMNSSTNNVNLGKECDDIEDSRSSTHTMLTFNLHNNFFWTTMTYERNRKPLCNSFHNTKTSRNELQIILWRLLKMLFFFNLNTFSRGFIYTIINILIGLNRSRLILW